MNHYQKGWVEALIDSEGSLGVQKSHIGTPYAVLQIYNKRKDFLEHAQSIIGGKIYERKHKHPKWSRMFMLVLYGKELRPLLPKLSLIIKEKQRKLLIDLLRVQTPIGAHLTPVRREYIRSLAKELKILNRRGRSIGQEA